MANKNLCPRCGSHDIVEYETTIECMKCHFEFKKENLADLDDEDILSVQEMKDILDELGLNQDSDKLTKMKEIFDIEDSFNQKKHKN